MTEKRESEQEEPPAQDVAASDQDRRGPGEDATDADNRAQAEEDTANQGQTEVTQGEGRDSSESATGAEETEVAPETARGKEQGPYSIGIYSDPGRTSLLMRKLLNEDGEGWSRGAELIHKQVLVPLRTDATLDLEEVQRWAREGEADITVIVTEVPRMADSMPKTSELHFADKLAIISLPAVGPVAVRHSLRRELNRVVSALMHDSATEAREKGGFTSRVEEQKGHDTVFITPKRTFPGRVWMTLGMVASNEPLWSLPKLSGVFAAAAATGAFGFFFSTIWEMANYLPSWRLASVSAIAICAVMTWLILKNHLWDKPGSIGGKREALMYNMSTVVSLLVSVTTLYAMLFLGILAVSLLLIDPEFVSQEIGETASFASYIDIAWLSASMGTVAGAIGSNFDDDSDLENLTQGSRELQRYPRDDEQR